MLVGLLKDAEGFLVFVLVEILSSDGDQHFGMIRWIAGIILAFNDVLRALEKIIDGQRLARWRRVGEQKTVQIADLFGAGQFAECKIALLTGAPGLKKSSSCAGDYSEQSESRKRYGQAVPAHKLSGAIGERIRAGANGFMLEVSREIIGEGGDG